MVSASIKAFLLVCYALSLVSSHGPPLERDNEDIAMGRKMGAKWCSMAKVCNHDRVPVCGVSHAGDVMGFRDLCDMFDYNCIRRRRDYQTIKLNNFLHGSYIEIAKKNQLSYTFGSNYKQTGCPEDKSILTVSRRPTSSYYDD